MADRSKFNIIRSLFTKDNKTYFHFGSRKSTLYCQNQNNAEHILSLIFQVLGDKFDPDFLSVNTLRKVLGQVNRRLTCVG